MRSFCTFAGCSQWAAGFGNLCESHRSRKRRYGAPEQRAIRKSDLKPFVTEVERWIAVNPKNRTWSIAQQRWQAFVAGAEAVERTSIHGPTRKAAAEVQRIGRSVDAQAIVVTVIAMCLMRELEPAMFQNDEAFRLGVARRVRALSPLCVGQWQQSEFGRVKKALRELSPSVGSILGTWLLKVLGGAGIYLAQRRKAVRDEKQLEAADFSEALRDLDLD